jgi:hypothetical protein
LGFGVSSSKVCECGSSVGSYEVYSILSWSWVLF